MHGNAQHDGRLPLYDRRQNFAKNSKIFITMATGGWSGANLTENNWPTPKTLSVVQEYQNYYLLQK